MNLYKQLLERQPNRRASIEQLQIIATQLVRTSGGTDRDAHLFADDVRDMRHLGDSMSSVDNTLVSNSYQERKSDAQHHIGGSAQNNQFRIPPQQSRDDLDAIDQSAKVVPAVSAIGKAIAFVFSPPHDERTEAKARGVSMDSGRTTIRVLEKDFLGRPPIAASPRSGSTGPLVFHSGIKAEGVGDDMSLFRGIIGKAERDGRGPISIAPEEEGFVMIDPTGSGMRVSREQPWKINVEQSVPRQLPVINVPRINENKDRFHELSFLYCKAVHNVVFLADQFVSQGDKCKSQKMTDVPGTVVCGANERLFCEQFLVSFALYLHALSLLKMILQMTSEQPFLNMHKVTSFNTPSLLNLMCKCRI